MHIPLVLEERILGFVAELGNIKDIGCNFTRAGETLDRKQEEGLRYLRETLSDRGGK